MKSFVPLRPRPLVRLVASMIFSIVLRIRDVIEIMRVRPKWFITGIKYLRQKFSSEVYS